MYLLLPFIQDTPGNKCTFLVLLDTPRVSHHPPTTPTSQDRDRTLSQNFLQGDLKWFPCGPVLRVISAEGHGRRCFCISRIPLAFCFCSQFSEIKPFFPFPSPCLLISLSGFVFPLYLCWKTQFHCKKLRTPSFPGKSPLSSRIPAVGWSREQRQSPSLLQLSL